MSLQFKGFSPVWNRSWWTSGTILPVTVAHVFQHAIPLSLALSVSLFCLAARPAMSLSPRVCEGNNQGIRPLSQPFLFSSLPLFLSDDSAQVGLAAVRCRSDSFVFAVLIFWIKSTSLPALSDDELRGPDWHYLVPSFVLPLYPLHNDYRPSPPTAIESRERLLSAFAPFLCNGVAHVNFSFNYYRGREIYNHMQSHLVIQYKSNILL